MGAALPGWERARVAPNLRSRLRLLLGVRPQSLHQSGGGGPPHAPFLPSFAFVLSDERDKLIGRPCGDCGVWTHGRGGGRGRGSEEEEGSRSASESESSRRRVERKRERRRPSVWRRREREVSQEVRSLPSSSTLDRGVVVVERGAVRAACKQRHAVSRPSSMVHVRLSALQCRMYQSAEMKAYVPTDGWGTGGLRLHKATKCSSRLGGRWL